jgi:hypothetical protein
MTPHPLANYLNDCRSCRGTGATTGETSLYPPLEALFNAAGQTLKPRVRCFMSLKNQGAGLPDGGLFTPDQIPRGTDELPAGQTPSRGVIECKKPKEDVLAIAETEQVSGYRDRYNQVLVTNYREFLLIGRDDHGKPVRHEFYRLAATEKEFWQRPVEAAVVEHDDRLLDFLKDANGAVSEAAEEPEQRVGDDPDLLLLASVLLVAGGNRPLEFEDRLEECVLRDAGRPLIVHEENRDRVRNPPAHRGVPPQALKHRPLAACFTGWRRVTPRESAVSEAHHLHGLGRLILLLLEEVEDLKGSEFLVFVDDWQVDDDAQALLIHDRRFGLGARIGHRPLPLALKVNGALATRAVRLAAGRTSRREARRVER